MARRTKAIIIGAVGVVALLFSGAVPAEEMAQAFRRAWEILRSRAA